jgi:hypothetical protein
MALASEHMETTIVLATKLSPPLPLPLILQKS